MSTDKWEIETVLVVEGVTISVLSLDSAEEACCFRTSTSIFPMPWSVLFGSSPAVELFHLIYQPLSLLEKEQVVLYQVLLDQLQV